MATAPTLSEADILQQVIAGRDSGFAPETARELLKLSFDRPTTTRIRRLLNKNNRGNIQADEQAVRQLARGRCEYCRLPEDCTVLPHAVDHIRARKHRGATTLRNTCFACAYCNAAKGSNPAGYDPVTDELMLLFNPRSDHWSEHFEWRGSSLVGKTKTGRATIEVLRINAAERIAHRRLLRAVGVRFD